MGFFRGLTNKSITLAHSKLFQEAKMKMLLLAGAPSRAIINVVALLALSLAPCGLSARAENETEVECTAPDGRIEMITSQTRSGFALFTDGETLRCPLQLGRSTFVIKMTGAALLDRLKFVNENAAAAGELQISVSNSPLSAGSSEWVAVDGRIAFQHKRLFNLSMVGVEARYVRLSFNVESAAQIGQVPLSRTVAQLSQ